jgi:hypothetical protein
VGGLTARLTSPDHFYIGIFQASF